MTRDDAVALLALTCEDLRMAPPHFRLSSMRGHARSSISGRHSISVPRWALQRSEVFATYYVMHELAHVVCNKRLVPSHDHNPRFKEVEQSLCIKWGVEIVEYTDNGNGAYPVMGHSPLSDGVRWRLER